MWSISLLPLIPGPLWPRMVVPVRVSSMDQIDLFKNFRLEHMISYNCVQTNNYRQIISAIINNYRHYRQIINNYKHYRQIKSAIEYWKYCYDYK